jgi:hypothetical protein
VVEAHQSGRDHQRCEGDGRLWNNGFTRAFRNRIICAPQAGKSDPVCSVCVKPRRRARGIAQTKGWRAASFGIKLRGTGQLWLRVNEWHDASSVQSAN